MVDNGAVRKNRKYGCCGAGKRNRFGKRTKVPMSVRAVLAVQTKNGTAHGLHTMRCGRKGENFNAAGIGFNQLLYS